MATPFDSHVGRHNARQVLSHLPHSCALVVLSRARAPTGVRCWPGYRRRIMLNDLETYAILPLKDLQRARGFYKETLARNPQTNEWTD